MSSAQHIYQAIGELQATLVVADDGTKFLQSGSEHYPVFIPHQVEKKCQSKYQGQQVYWRVYAKSAAQGLVFEVSTVVDAPVIGIGQFQLQGDWIESGQLQIWRNANPGKINPHNWRPRQLPISWDSAPTPDGSFWQLKARLVVGTLRIEQALGPFPHPPRLEQLPEFKHQLQQKLEELPQQPSRPTHQPVTIPKTIQWEELAPVSGKLELSIKINTLPQVQQSHGRCHFKIDCDGRVFQVSVKPKLWAKLETASANYDQWVAAIAGKLGAATTDGFVLESPNIQVFERQQSKQAELPLESEVAQVQASASFAPKATTEPQAASEAKTPQVKTQTVEATTAKSVPESLELPDPQARPSTPKSESKPKKIGKFNVEIR